MTVHLEPFAAEHVPEAAALLERWYGRAGKGLPRLGAGDGESLVARRLAAAGPAAVAARSGRGTLTGYLAAAPVDLAGDERAALYGHPRSAVVGLGGHALEDGREAEVLRELYAAVAERLVGQGRYVHYVQLPADDAVAMAWFRIGFGLEQVRGLMPVKARGRQPRGVEGLTIRRAGPGDLPQVGRMAVEVAREHQQAATFQPQPPEALRALHTHYSATLADPRSAAFVAVRRGEEVGMVLLTPAGPGPATPPHCADLAEAYVEPSVRGEGISRVLLATALAWAYDTGYRSVTAAWRSTSRTGAGHWPAVGFKPVAYRLSRVLQRPG